VSLERVARIIYQFGIGELVSYWENALWGMRKSEGIGEGDSNPVTVRKGDSNPVTVRKGDSNPVTVRKVRRN